MKKDKDKLSLEAQLQLAKAIGTIPSLASEAINIIVLRHLKKYTMLLQEAFVNEKDSSGQKIKQLSTLPETLSLSTKRLGGEVRKAFQADAYLKYVRQTMIALTPDVDLPSRVALPHELRTRKSNDVQWYLTCRDALQGEPEDSENYKALLVSLKDYEPSEAFYSNLKPSLQNPSILSLLKPFTVKYVKDLISTIGLLPTAYLIATLKEAAPEALKDYEEKLGATKQSDSNSNQCLGSFLACFTKEQQAALEKWLTQTCLLLEQTLCKILMADIQTWVNLLINEIEQLLKQNSGFKPQPAKKDLKAILKGNLLENGARHKVVENLLDTGLFRKEALVQEKNKKNLFSFFVCNAKKKASKSVVDNVTNVANDVINVANANASLSQNKAAM